MESAKKRPVPEKKAKFITPEKTGELLFKIIPITNNSALLDLFGGSGWF